MNKAFVFINYELGSEIQVLEVLKNYEWVRSVQGVFWAYDILANLECKQHEELRQNIIGTIRNIKNVRSTMTLMTINKQC